MSAPAEPMTVEVARLQRKVEQMTDVLTDCLEYFDERADADGDCDGFHPNEEMRLQAKIEAVLP